MDNKLQNAATKDSHHENENDAHNEDDTIDSSMGDNIPIVSLLVLCLCGGISLTFYIMCFIMGATAVHLYPEQMDFVMRPFTKNIHFLMTYLNTVRIQVTHEVGTI